MRHLLDMNPFLTLILISLSTPALACPPAPGIVAAEGALLAEAQAAKTPGAAAHVSDALWRLWAQAPDEKAQELLDKGMAARAGWDFATALDAFDALTTYCPDYAEGYNQRAFVNFLRQDYTAALTDLELAIARSPRHVAAISGKALTLMGLDRQNEAQLVLREAMRLNPWIPERGLLTIPMDEDL